VRRVRRRRQHLARVGAAVRSLVDDDEVGERPPDIHRHPIAAQDISFATGRAVAEPASGLILCSRLVEPEPILDLSSARVFFDSSLGPVRLDHAEGVAVQPDGSVWCGGESGQVYRIAPDGSSLEVRVDDRDGFTLALAFGPDGLLYYVDLARRSVMRLDPAGGGPAAFGAGSIRGRPPGAPAARPRRRGGAPAPSGGPPAARARGGRGTGRPL